MCNNEKYICLLQCLSKRFFTQIVCLVHKSLTLSYQKIVINYFSVKIEQKCILVNMHQINI